MLGHVVHGQRQGHAQRHLLHDFVDFARYRAVVAGDAGTLLRWVGSGWVPVRTGVAGSLRAAAAVGAEAWIVGESGTVIELVGEAVRRIDVGTACTLRAVFPEGTSVWIVGSDGLRGGAWRITPNGTDRWGTC